MSTYIFVLSLLLLSLTMIMCCSFLSVFACCYCCCCCSFVCLCVPFFPFAKLVLFRFLSWFSISLTCSIYIHVTSFFCTLVLGSTNIFYYIPVKAQCHFFVYLKVDGGQLESFCYFDHHTHLNFVFWIVNLRPGSDAVLHMSRIEC